MTVSYSNHVFTSKGCGTFLKLLSRWIGSIYKLVWRELVIYILLYSGLSVLYRFVLKDESKRLFERMSVYCRKNGVEIPITFVLGFYVSLIVNRWWQMFESIPWPDSQALWVSSCISGPDERCRLMRRTIVRYLNLGLVLTLRLTCLPVRKRFPTLDHLVEAGILEEKEKEILVKVENQSHHPNYWMPLKWACSVAKRARKENRIKNDHLFTELINQIDKYRGKAGALLNYDWVPVPLVYTQVVTLAVYSYLLSTLMGSQFLEQESMLSAPHGDLYIPIFTFLQFFFYMGWLKVAEALINPFGEDDDDFEMNWIIDRNLQVSYLIVDEMHEDHPDLVRDQFWDELFPEMPYTAASEDTKIDPVIGSAAQFEVPADEAGFIHDDLRTLIVDGDGHSNSNFYDKEKEIGARSFPSRASSIDSRITIEENGNGSSRGKLRPSIISKLNTAFTKSRGSMSSGVAQTGKSVFGSSFSILSKSRPRRASRIRRSNSKQSFLSTDRNGGGLERGAIMTKDLCNEEKRTGPMVKSESNESLDSNQRPNSEFDPNQCTGFPRPSSNFARFVQNDNSNDFLHVDTSNLHQRNRKISISSTNSFLANQCDGNKAIKRKYEILHSFTLATLNAMCQELESCDCDDDVIRDPIEMFRVLDQTHQQYRSKLLKAIKKISDQNEDDNEGQLNIDSELETIAEVVNDTLPSSDVVSTINISEEEEEQNWSENPHDDISDSKADKDDSPDEATSSLTTIEEQPELGYNSDSSETDFLIPSRTRTSMDLGSNPANILPTLHEDPSEKDHHNH